MCFFCKREGTDQHPVVMPTEKPRHRWEKRQAQCSDLIDCIQYQIETKGKPSLRLVRR